MSSGRRLKETESKKSIDAYFKLAKSSKSIPNCEVCGKKMKIKHSKKNDYYFWGCSRFPDCHFSKEL